MFLHRDKQRYGSHGVDHSLQCILGPGRSHHPHPRGSLGSQPLPCDDAARDAISVFLLLMVPSGYSSKPKSSSAWLFDSLHLLGDSVHCVRVRHYLDPEFLLTKELH